jgi:hypothetical protein
VRVDAGFGRRLANEPTFRGDERQPPPPGAIDETVDYDGCEDQRRDLTDLDRTGQSYAPENLQGPPGIETRRAKMETVWLLRPFGAWTPDNFTGTHAALGLRPGAPGQLPGDMQPWDTPRRTLRALPLVPWDAGTAEGPGSL